VEIEDRGIIFRSWKKYAQALSAEVKCLQQLLPTDSVALGFRAFKREAEG